MEDLREEPELEEREEEDEEEEEEEETQEPELEPELEPEPREEADEPREQLREEKQQQQREEEKEEEEEEEEKEEEEDESNDQNGKLLVRPVRNAASRASLTDELNPVDSQGLLETNFSVTGLNEIKTERIIPRTNNIARDTPKRPMSLDLSAPMKLKKPRGVARPEKVTARLIDRRLVTK